MPAPTTLKSSIATGTPMRANTSSAGTTCSVMRQAHTLGELHADEAGRQAGLLQAALHEADEMRLDDGRIGKIHGERRRILLPHRRIAMQPAMSSPITRRSIIDASP